MNHPENIAAAIEAGRKLGALTSEVFEGPNGEHHVIVPDGYELKSVGMEPMRPERIKAHACFYDVRSFTEYVKDFRSDVTRLFGDVMKRTITAAIDYHGASEPSYCEHTAQLICEPSLAWQLWTKVNAQPMRQDHFAEFIEDNLVDIIDPDAAKLVEIAQTLTATNNTRIVSGKRLHDGNIRFEYKEDIEAKAGAHGDLEIPQVITLGLAPFVGSELRHIKARLRFRIPRNGDEAVAFSVHLERTEDILHAVFEDELCRAVSEALESPIHFGFYR